MRSNKELARDAIISGQFNVYRDHGATVSRVFSTAEVSNWEGDFTIEKRGVDV